MRLRSRRSWRGGGLEGRLETQASTATSDLADDVVYVAGLLVR